MLKVFNVGQGDALLISPRNSCVFGEVPLLVDTGSAGAKVIQKVLTEKIDVLITHSHADHVGGLPDFLKSNRVKCLFLPLYLAEVGKIFQYLHKQTKIKLRPLDWSVIAKSNFRLVAQGDKLCNHGFVLNPPRSPAAFASLVSESGLTLEAAFNVLANLGIDLPRDEIRDYRSPAATDVTGIDEGFARIFVHKFFISLADYLITVNANTTNLSYYVTKKLELTSNEASLVFKYSHAGEFWLFTGDADENVFQRLVSEGVNISAKYLKVPHHGSRENLSKKSLDDIAPTYAIVSHKNGKFGRSLDPHPHSEIMELLDQKKVISYYTNDVLKKGVVIKTATVGSVLTGLIEFI